MKKLALLVGNDRYRDAKLTRLAVPKADVRALEGVLKRRELCGFDDVTVLLNPPLAVAMMAIGHLFQGRRRDDLVLFYFSGHGLLDSSGDLYLAFPQSQYDAPLGTTLSASFVKEAMNKSGSRRQVLILDCCYSGAFDRGTKGAGAPAVTESTFEVRGYGREILTSSAATQLAWEGQELIGETDRSLFTHFLVEGLETGAAAPQESETITVEQLYHYAHDRVIAITPAMTPQRWADRLQGSLAIARNPRWRMEPKPLPEPLLKALIDEAPFVREGAVRELGRLLRIPLKSATHSSGRLPPSPG